MQQSRTKNAKRNIFWGMVQKIVGLFCPFLVRTVMIYYMGTLYVGLNGLFTSILQVLSLAELGFGEAMVFSMYKPIAENNKGKICALLALYKKIYTTIGIVILGAGMIIMPFLDNLISGNVPDNINIYVLYMVYLLNTSLSYFLYAYKGSLFIASQRNDIKTNINTITSLIMYILQMLVLVLFRSYYIYCIAILFTTVLNNFLIEYKAIRVFPEFIPSGKVADSEKTDIQKRVSGVFIYKVCGVFRNSFDSIIISAFLGLTVLAQYQNYYFIVNAIMGLMLIITTSITSGVGNSLASESVEKNYNDFTKFQYIYMWITSWCTACLFGLFQPFMELWVGTESMYSNAIASIFCVYFFTSQMGNICYVYRQAAGLWWQDRYRPIIEAVVNLTLNIALVKLIGVSGVLLSTIACLVLINFVWGAHILYKHYFVGIREKGYLLRTVLFSIVTCLGCVASMAIANLYTTTGILNLIARGITIFIVSSLIYVLCTLFLPECKSALMFVKRVILH